MRAFEDYSLRCFREGVAFTVEGDTLLGCVRHRGLVPWAGEMHVAALEDQHQHQQQSDAWRSLPTYCGPQRASRGSLARLAERHGDLEIDPSLRAQWADELGFDPGLPPVAAVPEFDTVDEGLRKTSGLEPFCVQNCSEFDFDAPSLEAAILRERAPMQAYHPSSGLRFEPVWIAPAAALSRLRAATLDVNIFDTPANVPAEAIPRAFRGANPKHARFPFGVGYLLSPARSETLFHSDGYVHTYNWLAEGEKFWWFVEPHRANEAWLAERTITEIVTTEGFARWGRVRVLHQRARTAAVFPGHWPHRVHTLSTAIGLAGYTHLPFGAVTALAGER
jgi:hypothetical protein